MCLKVIGAGFGRTGTHSLKIALETLGFGPCYHMYELVNNDAHVGLWNIAAANESFDWNILFKNFQSAVDWPTCAYWKELVTHYKNAKVVLTVREPEEWYEDAICTIFKALEIGRRLNDRKKRSRCEMSGQLILEKTFAGRHDDKDFVISKYIKHTEKIKSLIPKNQLLEFDVSEGWGPLCGFLEVQVPQISFPAANFRDDFLKGLLRGDM